MIVYIENPKESTKKLVGLISDFNKIMEYKSYVKKKQLSFILSYIRYYVLHSINEQIEIEYL